MFNNDVFPKSVDFELTADRNWSKSFINTLLYMTFCNLVIGQLIKYSRFGGSCSTSFFSRRNINIRKISYRCSAFSACCKTETNSVGSENKCLIMTLRRLHNSSKLFWIGVPVSRIAWSNFSFLIVPDINDSPSFNLCPSSKMTYEKCIFDKNAYSIRSYSYVVNRISKRYGFNVWLMISARSIWSPINLTSLKEGHHFFCSFSHWINVDLGTTMRCFPFTP